MPDRVVALQLLTWHLLAVILPPLPPVIHAFSAIYDRRHTEPISTFHSTNQGRKFGGYRIIPKTCKDLSTKKDNTGVCMFNHECSQKEGTVIGSCMDGFLYGACCRLPPGVSISVPDLPTSTSVSTITMTTFDKSTSAIKPQIYHSPQETFLIYANGTAVQHNYSPEDFANFTKERPFVPNIGVSDTIIYASTFPEGSYSTIDYKLQQQNNNLDNSVETENSDPSQTFYLNRWPTTSKPIANGQTLEHDRSSTSYSSKLHSTTASSNQEYYNPDFLSTRYSPFYTYSTTKGTYTSTSTTAYPSIYIGNNHNSANGANEEEENLIRVPTISADSIHKQEPNDESINHILSILNQTRLVSTPTTETVTQSQALYTWLSVQNSPDRISSYTTRPISNTVNQDQIKLSTQPPLTTIHHIPGPSFHVTPEVKITPKPQPGVSETAPTVIVLTPAHQASTKPPSNKPLYSYSTTTQYNVSYHHTKPTTSKPATGKPSTTSKKPISIGKPIQSVLITAKPPQASYTTVRPPSSVPYNPKPTYHESTNTQKPNIASSVVSNVPGYTTFRPSSTVYLASNVPIKTTYISTLQSSAVFNNYPPQGETFSQTTTATTTTTTSIPSNHQNTLVTTAKPITASIPNNAQGGPSIKPYYETPQVLPYTTTAIPILTNNVPYVTARPPGTSTYSPLLSHPFINMNTNHGYPLLSQGMLVNSTEDLIAFPPVRDPNVNLTANLPEKPMLTATTTFGEEDTITDNEVTPQFLMDKTLEDKVHVFVEKIVQSLQGNFEDLEKVLITGDATGNVTISNEAATTKKPTNITKKPSTTKPNKKPTITSTTTIRPPRPSTTIIQQPSIGTTYIITNRPIKQPTLATPVSLFQPTSTVQSTTSSPPKIQTSISGTQQVITIESDSSSVTEVVTSETSTTIKTTASSEGDYRRECGIRPLARKNGRIVGGKGSAFGQWPWQVLVREATWLGLFTKNKCGGVLITNKYVITAAHCQPGFLANLVAVFGEHDINGEVESKRSISKNVKRVIVHRQYDAATFENDIALLELESSVSYDSHIVPICMPEDDDDFTGRMATVTGWGRLKYGGGVPNILQEVQVPIMENRVCQEMFHTAGHSKTILNSFLCAGYANGQRDSCEGDSGGPLMIERDGRWVLVATVSHGIKCAAPYLPGVYMRTTYYKPWLQTITGV